MSLINLLAKHRQENESLAMERQKQLEIIYKRHESFVALLGGKEYLSKYYEKFLIDDWIKFNEEWDPETGNRFFALAIAQKRELNNYLLLSGR